CGCGGVCWGLGGLSHHGAVQKTRVFRHGLGGGGGCDRNHHRSVLFNQWVGSNGGAADRLYISEWWLTGLPPLPPTPVPDQT
ncbi:MAG: hypothetical protein AAF808_01035, partial [Cyanobacteria bacterium P01_D01_bin.2]